MHLYERMVQTLTNIILMIVIMNLNYIKEAKVSQENVKDECIVINKITRSLNKFERKQTILLHFFHYILGLRCPKTSIRMTGFFIHTIRY